MSSEGTRHPRRCPFLSRIPHTYAVDCRHPKSGVLCSCKQTRRPAPPRNITTSFWPRQSTQQAGQIATQRTSHTKKKRRPHSKTILAYRPNHRLACTKGRTNSTTNKRSNHPKRHPNHIENPEALYCRRVHRQRQASMKQTNGCYPNIIKLRQPTSQPQRLRFCFKLLLPYVKLPPTLCHRLG